MCSAFRPVTGAQFAPSYLLENAKRTFDGEQRLEWEQHWVENQLKQIIVRKAKNHWKFAVANDVRFAKRNSQPGTRQILLPWKVKDYTYIEICVCISCFSMLAIIPSALAKSPSELTAVVSFPSQVGDPVPLIIPNGYTAIIIPHSHNEVRTCGCSGESTLGSGEMIRTLAGLIGFTNLVLLFVVFMPTILASHRFCHPRTCALLQVGWQTSTESIEEAGVAFGTNRDRTLATLTVPSEYQPKPSRLSRREHRVSRHLVLVD